MMKAYIRKIYILETALLITAASALFAIGKKDKKDDKKDKAEQTVKVQPPAEKPKDTAGLPAPAGETRTAEEGLAAQAFRLGVLSYYRGSFSEAAILFEKALSYKSDDNLILDWMAKAYYRFGQEGEALEAWRAAIEGGYGGLLLQGKAENVAARRLTGYEREGMISSLYTQSGAFSGVRNGVTIFREPTGVLSCADGSVWIVAYGSNEIIRLNVNGEVFSRITGPLGGFDRPLDMIRLRGGNLLLSESAGDCLSLLKDNGTFIKRIGGKGRAVGQCVGPQYIAEDENGNIYVSDYGNRRVDVFDAEGNGLFYIGTVKHGRDDSDGERREFGGLKGPTGVALLGEGSSARLFVADDVTGSVYEFDRSGNFIRVLVEEGTFRHPESLKVWGARGEEMLIICDGNRVCSIDTMTGEVSERSRTGNGPTRATSAVCDVNGNMLVADMKADEVLVMSDMSEVVGSLFTQIERVHSDAFPAVTLEVRVEDRHRRAIVGLREENFHITENGQNVLEQTFAGAANNNRVADVCVVIDRSAQMAQYEAEVAQAVHDIADGMMEANKQKGLGNDGQIHIICAGNTPTEEYAGSPAPMMAFKTEAIRTPIAAYTDRVPLDKALRLSGGALINGERKRAIVLVTGGGAVHSYDNSTLSQLSAYLNNNAISLAVINVTQGSVEDEVSYLCKDTEGGEYYVFRPEGLTSIVNDLIAVPNGLYEISYTSQLPTNMGEAYLKVEAESYLMGRSGRDESGYFAPLQ